MIDEETTLRLGDERDRLAQQHDEVQELVEEGDDSASASAARWSLNEIDQMGAAVTELITEHGEDATVTIKGLAAGEFGRVEDRVDTARSRRDGASIRGYHRVVYAAAGLVEAPFFSTEDVTDPSWDDRPPKERLDAKIQAVAAENIGLVKWLYSRVDEETTADEGNWKQSAGHTGGTVE